VEGILARGDGGMEGTHFNEHGIKAIGVAPVISKIILKTNTFILMIWLNAVNLP